MTVAFGRRHRQARLLWLQSLLQQQRSGRIVHGFPYNLKADGCYEDAHQGADEVEEAVGQVGQRGHAEDGGLRHAARVPGDEGRGDGDGVLGGAAQQAGLVALLAVDAAEHVARQDDADVLVGGGQVEEEARCHGGCHQAEGVLHETHEDRRDAAQHAAGRHGAAEAHGAEDEPDGVHHARHAAGGHQLGQHGVARLQAGTAVDAHQGAFEEAAAVGNFAQQVGLEDEGEEDGQQGGQEQGDDRGHLAGNEDAGDDGHHEQPGADGEPLVQRGGYLGYLSRVARFVYQAHDGEDNQGDNQGRHGGNHHVADVGEEGCLRHRCRQHGGVRQGRDLVAEVGARDDGACCPALFEALRLADAHQGDADGGDGGPRAARHDGHQDADDARGGEEEVGMDNLHAVVNQRRDNAAHHPHSAQGADDEQDDDGRGHTRDVVGDGNLEVLPRDAVESHADECAGGGGEEQRNLAAPVQRVAAEGVYGACQQTHQQHDGNQGDQRRGNSFRCIHADRCIYRKCRQMYNKNVRNLSFSLPDLNLLSNLCVCLDN